MMLPDGGSFGATLFSTPLEPTRMPDNVFPAFDGPPTAERVRFTTTSTATASTRSSWGATAGRASTEHSAAVVPSESLAGQGFQ